MDFIDSLLILEDDLDENQEDDDLGEFGESSMAAMDLLSKTRLEKSCRSLQVRVHQIGVFAADVDLCPKKLRTSVVKIGKA